MRKPSGSELAISSVLGVALLIALTVLMVSTIALSVFAFDALEPPEPAPEAKILAVEAKGGLPPSVTFASNIIKLKHKGGDGLDLKRTKIIIYGNGRSYRPVFGGGYVPPHPNTGIVQVIYLNLTASGKITDYNATNRALLNDGLWSTGETLLLSGEDSLNSHDDSSSVWVIVDGDSETSNNYGFKPGDKISVIVIDTITEQIISTMSVTVRKT